MRPRLARMAERLDGLVGAARGRRRTRRLPPRPTVEWQTEEVRSREEMKRRLDETRARLKRERPPRPES